MKLNNSIKLDSHVSYNDSGARQRRGGNVNEYCGTWIRCTLKKLHLMQPSRRCFISYIFFLFFFLNIGYLATTDESRMCGTTTAGHNFFSLSVCLNALFLDAMHFSSSRPHTCINTHWIASHLLRKHFASDLREVLNFFRNVDKIK